MHEAGITLLETLVATLIGGMVIMAADVLWTSAEGYFRQVATVSAPLADSSSVYWTVERLAQNAKILGTQSLSTDEEVIGATSGSVPVLAMTVTTLQGIVPANSAVYGAASGAQGGTDYLCLAVVPVNGVPMLALFPGGEPFNPTASPPIYPPASEVTPIGTGQVSYAGTTFSVLPAGTGVVRPVEFEMNVVARTVSADGEQPSHEAQSGTSQVYSFMAGAVDY